MTAPALAVTGLGAVSACGPGTTALLEAMRAGRVGIEAGAALGLQASALAPLPDCDIARDAGVLGIDATLAANLQRHAHRAGHARRATLLAAAQAWCQAGSTAAADRVALIVSGSNLDQQGVAESMARAMEGRAVRPGYAGEFMDTDHVGAVSEALGIRGEGYAIGGASASGGVALAHARRALLSGEVDAVLVVGVPMMLSSAELQALAAAGAMYRGAAPRAGECVCRPFDRAAAGFVYGQASAAMVLEPEAAVHGRGGRTLARLAAAAMGLDANRSTNPSVPGEVGAMRRALSQAGLDAAAIDLVSAHGTASLLGDRTEATALAEVFAEAGCRPAINMPKALFGHCLASAGLLEAVALVLQMRAGFAHGNPALDTPIDDRLDWVGTHARACRAVAAMSNSFGFGGINSSQIFTLPQESHP
ncbi:polyketide beta-ketoacyl:acyl carrier protein synthase [Burkholderia lata]|uniref:Polyketide beta-ketoacyl:acyl carrier protein synthase n=1 Tax=Burkholderia lata (strain ATCC 17760 / DSM 23089 / LMG 22485 / NCIMB 9086 / R18194 / 383) TaxID=482957 RepID=A0A6P2UU49_BURL3|nr:beta-ketoacyl synthase N-terminal-like domain-containing protein [Burkholderia lata]VWC72339.1 polyketide beta-ketoacyl:acyl carrier protein synthase [Burkholderia lata]